MIGRVRRVRQVGQDRHELQARVSALIVKHFYGFFSEDKIGEFAFIAGGFYDVIVYPMIVASAGFAKDDAVILKAVLFEPLLGNFPVCFGT